MPIDVQTIVSWNIIILFITLTIFGPLLIIIWTSTLVKAIKEKRFKRMLPEWLMITKENKKYWIITMILVIVAIAAYNIGFTSIIFALGLPFIIIGLWSIWLHTNGKIMKMPYWTYRPLSGLPKLLNENQLTFLTLLISLLLILMGVAVFFSVLLRPLLAFLIFINTMGILALLIYGIIIKYRRTLLPRSEYARKWIEFIFLFLFVSLLSLITIALLYNLFPFKT
jgi:MFS family permease